MCWCDRRPVKLRNVLGHVGVDEEVSPRRTEGATWVGGVGAPHGALPLGRCSTSALRGRRSRDARAMLARSSASRARAADGADATHTCTHGTHSRHARSHARTQRHTGKSAPPMPGQAGVPVFGLDPSGKITEWNTNLVKLTGLKLSDVEGKRLVEVACADCEEAITQCIDHVLKVAAKGEDRDAPRARYILVHQGPVRCALVAVPASFFRRSVGACLPLMRVVRSAGLLARCMWSEPALVPHGHAGPLGLLSFGAASTDCAGCPRPNSRVRPSSTPHLGPRNAFCSRSAASLGL